MYNNNQTSFVAIEADGSISSWGDCLPDCPLEEPEVACMEDPIFPPYSEEGTNQANFTTTFVPNTNQIVAEVISFIRFNSR